MPEKNSNVSHPVVLNLMNVWVGRIVPAFAAEILSSAFCTMPLFRGGGEETYASTTTAGLLRHGHRTK